MTTTISYVDDRHLRIDCERYGWLMCEPADFNRQHEGYWNSTVFAFIPRHTHFSDGTPVAIYEQFN